MFLHFILWRSDVICYRDVMIIILVCYANLSLMCGAERLVGFGISILF